MENILQRIAENLFGRLDGPLHFRIILQPLVAIVFAVIDGVKDAKIGKGAYFWTILISPGQRKEFIKDGWKHIGKIFIIAIILDIIYQLKVFHTIYPVEILIVSFFLAIAPYLLLRGPVNRLMQLLRRKHS